MGFFSDLKDDLSQAVNELMPEEELDAALAGEKISEGEDAKKLQGGIITSEELSDMLDKVEAMSAENDALNAEADTAVPDAADEPSLQEEVPAEEIPLETPEETVLADVPAEEAQAETLVDAPPAEELPLETLEETALTDGLPEEVQADEPVDAPSAEETLGEMALAEETTLETPQDESASEGFTDEMQVETPEETVTVEDMEADMPKEAVNELREGVQEGMKEEVVKEESIETNEAEQEKKGEEKKMDTQPKVASDETAVVTEGMSIIGDITSGGSLELLGSVTGNIDILGKLNVTGSIQGNSKAAEIFAEGARVNGEINSQGSVKIGQSSVIIGNIFANSAVIAGAVKGDIDIHGPVVLDTSAIVMGNIKSKSVQINNGAVIEGMCSQCYAEVNPTSFFEEIKKKKESK